MNNDFNFSKIGKRMPYTVPDGFFDGMEADVRRQAARKTAAGMKLRVRRIALTAAASVAAAVALPLLLNGGPDTGRVCGMDDVEQAFAELSSADQAYLLEVYDEDIFLNQ